MGVVDLWPSPTGRGSEYHLTPAGKDLGDVVVELGRWAVHWRFDDLRPDDVDAVNLLWWMHRRVDESTLPATRVVIEFVHTAPTRTVIWMVLDRGEASVCLQHPGFDSDLVVTSTTRALAEVFSGVRTWGEAVSAEDVTVAGPPALARRFPRWFLWSPFADDARAMAVTRS
jgi:hypothetical protein